MSTVVDTDTDRVAPEAASFEELLSWARSASRRMLRDAGLPVWIAGLPELDPVAPPRVLPGQVVVAAAGGPFHPVVFHRRDGSVIDLPLLEAAAVGEAEAGGRSVWRAVRSRSGLRVVVDTAFSPIDLGIGGDMGGPPLLWETRVFYGGRRGGLGKPAEVWRYATREAAEAGHREVVDALDAAVRVRRALRSPAPHLGRVIRPSGRADRLRAAYAGGRR